MTREDPRPTGQFDDADLLVSVVGAVMSRFTAEVGHYRDLVSMAVGRHRRPTRPKTLRELGDRLVPWVRESIDETARRTMDRIGGDIGSILQALAADSEPPPGKRFHPIPPEQVVGQVLAHAGRDMSDGWFSDLERACGESGQAQRYALSVMGWLSSSLDSDYLGRAIVPALVAAFERLSP